MADAKRSLYVCRPLINGNEVREWARTQGFKTALPAHDMHVTIVFSRDPVSWDVEGKPKSKLKIIGGRRSIHKFGDAIVLCFSSKTLSDRWRKFCDAGASWDHDGYKPHVTISYSGNIDPDDIEPYRGALDFGQERFSEIKKDASNDIAETKIASAGSRAKRLFDAGRISEDQYKRLN